MGYLPEEYGHLPEEYGHLPEEYGHLPEELYPQEYVLPGFFQHFFIVIFICRILGQPALPRGKKPHPLVKSK